MESALKVSPINHYSNQVALTSSCTYETHIPTHVTHTHTHTHTHTQKGTTRTQEMLPENNMRAYHTRRQINTHAHKLPRCAIDFTHPDLSGVSEAEKLIQWCVGGAEVKRKRGADAWQHKPAIGPQRYRHKVGSFVADVRPFRLRMLSITMVRKWEAATKHQLSTTLEEWGFLFFFPHHLVSTVKELYNSITQP